MAAGDRDRFSHVFEFARNRDPFFAALDDALANYSASASVAAPSSGPWKELFLAMLHQGSPLRWLRARGIELGSPPLPACVSELDRQLAEARLVLGASVLGRQFIPYGWGDRSQNAGNVFERNSMILTRLLTAGETHNMLLLKRVLEQRGYPVSMWINDAFEVVGDFSGGGGGDDDNDGLAADEYQSRFLDELRPHLDEVGFSSHLRLRFKSKAASVDEWETRLARWDQERAAASAALPLARPLSSLGYDDLKWMAETQDHLAFCRKEGQYVVLNRDDGEFPFPALVSREAVKARYEHYPRVPDRYSDRYVPFVDAWLGDPDRRQYDATAFFYRDEVCPPTIYNLYTGMNVERWDPVTPDEWRDPALVDEVAFFWAHLRTLVDNDEHVGSWKDWLAHIFQFPSVKTKLCRVLYSIRQGVGKNLFEEVLKQMLGPRLYCFSAKPEEELLGTFTAVLEGKLLVVINESAINSKSCIEIFKDLITNPTINVRKMRTELFARRCCANFLITTNNDSFTTLSENERRYEFSCSDAERMTPDRATRLAAIQTNRRVLRMIYEELMQRPMTRDYDFAGHRVQSRVYTNLVETSRPIQIKFFAEWLSSLMMPAQTSSLFVVSGSSAAASAASSSGASNVPGDVEYHLTGVDLYAAYKTWAENAGLSNNQRAIEPREQFIGRLIGLLEVARGEKTPGESGVTYRKIAERNVAGTNTGNSLHQKMAWSIQVAKCRQFIERRYSGGGA